VDHPWRTIPPSPDIHEVLALIGHRHHHHHFPSGFHLLLPPGLLLLPSSIDIASQCGVVLLHPLKLFLDECQFFSNL
jgi:hypothetical protein